MTYTNAYRLIVANATPAQIEQAVAWYYDAELLAADLIRIYAERGIVVNLEQAASIISAFSPRERWSSNVSKATEFAMGGTPKGLTNNLRMAESALLNGFSALRGLKTNNFARAIAGDEFQADRLACIITQVYGDRRPVLIIYIRRNGRLHEAGQVG